MSDADTSGQDRPGLLEQDNYQVALEAAQERLRSCDAHGQAERAGATVEAEQISLSMLGEDYVVDITSGVVGRADGDRPPMWEQILVLHYLIGAPAFWPANGEQWTAFRELPDAAFFDSAFEQQVCEPVAARFGDDPSRFADLAGRWGSESGDGSDATLVFQVLPRVRLAFQLWAGDEDFPAEAKVLFSKSTAACLTAEDAAVLADVVLRRLLGA